MAAEKEKRTTRCHAVFLLLPFVSSSSVDAYVWFHPVQLTSHKHLLSLPFYMSLFRAFSIGAIFKGTKVSNSFQRANCTTLALWIFSSNWQQKLFLECLFNLESSIHRVKRDEKPFLARNNRVSRFSRSCFPLSRDSFIFLFFFFGHSFHPRGYSVQSLTRDTLVIFVIFVPC